MKFPLEAPRLGVDTAFLPPRSLSSQPSPSALHQAAIFLSSIRALALSQHPASLVSGGAEQSRDRAIVQHERGKGGGDGKWTEKGEERRVRLSDEDVAHAGDPGEITRVGSCGPWSGHMLIALFDIKK